MNLASATEEVAIRDLLARYCRGIDRLDADLLKSVYWPDSVDHHGVFDGPGPEFAEWIVPFLRQKYLFTTHMLGHSLIRRDGELAAVETYFSSLHGLAHDGYRTIESIAGRYVDRLERRQGDWRILERHLILDFVSESSHPRTAVEDMTAFAFGRRTREDVSYSCLP